MPLDIYKQGGLLSIKEMLEMDKSLDFFNVICQDIKNFLKYLHTEVKSCA